MTFPFRRIEQYARILVIGPPTTRPLVQPAEVFFNVDATIGSATKAILL
jgi:hypothetical protein